MFSEVFALSTLIGFATVVPVKSTEIPVITVGGAGDRIQSNPSSVVGCLYGFLSRASRQALIIRLPKSESSHLCLHAEKSYGGTIHVRRIAPVLPLLGTSTLSCESFFVLMSNSSLIPFVGIPVPDSNINGPFQQVQYTVTDSNPVWFYCRQTGHCKRAWSFLSTLEISSRLSRQPR